MSILDNTIHFVMQSKGGVGKSVVSSLLSQYFFDKLDNTLLIDIDPSNKTLASYKSLNVQQINIMKDDEELVDQSKFDDFLHTFIESESTCLVDTGSGEFLPFNNYLTMTGIPEILAEMDKKMYIHVPISYGQAEEETIKCLVKLASNYPDVPIVVWQNEYFGKGQTDFINTTAYKKLDNVIGVIKISKLNADTYEKDFSTMLKKSMTFDDVKNDEKVFKFLNKIRIDKIQKDIYSQIDDLFTTES